MPASRRRALAGMCRALADGVVDLDPGADPQRAHDAMLDLAGIGPWTAGYVVMRALGDPDAWPVADLGLIRASERLGLPGDARSLAERAAAWSPFRAYGTMHLWSFLAEPVEERLAA
jgi:AraC family transcriptional regulator of adaptative response / DNA-3-methyladenine glycosylase II